VFLSVTIFNGFVLQYVNNVIFNCY